ncbi:hypothetical protein CS022_24695, partial [Veronia nyctiphanis]
GVWQTADDIVITDDESTLNIASASVYQNGQENAADYTEGPAWEILVNNPADEDGTFNVAFNDQDYNSSFDKFEPFIYVTDLDGNQIKNTDRADGLFTVTSWASGANFHVPLKAGETGIRVYAKPKDDDLYDPGEQLSLRVNVDGSAYAFSQKATLQDDESSPQITSIVPEETTFTEGDDVELSWTLALNNASASHTTLRLDINNLGNEGDFASDTNGVFVVLDSEGNTLTTVNMSDAVNGIVEAVLPPGHASVQVTTTLDNDATYEATETFTLKAAVKDSGVWQTADDIVITDDESTLTIASASVYQNGQENAADYTEGPAWEIHVNNPADEDGTFNIAFNDQDYNSSFGKFEPFLYVTDLDGNQIKNTDRPDGLFTVTSWASGANFHVPLKAGETGIRVYAKPKDDDLYDPGEQLSLRVNVDGSAYVFSQKATLQDDADAPSIASVSNVTVT